MHRMRAEERVLLACAMRGPDPAAVRPLLDADLDWSRLVTRAVRHGLAPLLYVTLRSAGAPDAILAHLRELYDRQVARHNGRVAKLGEIGAALGGSGIPVIVLKGAALASAVYRDPAFRTMGDLDLLVRPSDLVEAYRVLRQLGYTPNESWHSEAWYEAYHHHLAPLDAADGSLIVELHRSIGITGGRARVPVDDLWERARLERIGPATFCVLAPTDLLLHLCLHLGHDNTFYPGKLRDLRDIAETIHRYGPAIEWDAVVGRARAWGASGYVYWALWLAQDMVYAAVPASVLDGLVDARQGPLTDRLLPRILRGAMLDRAPAALEMLMAETVRVLIDSAESGRTVGALIRLFGRQLRQWAR